jgi:hypothetical protein
MLSDKMLGRARIELTQMLWAFYRCGSKAVHFLVSAYSLDQVSLRWTSGGFDVVCLWYRTADKLRKAFRITGTL